MIAWNRLARCVRVKAGLGRQRHREEIAKHEAASGVRGTAACPGAEALATCHSMIGLHGVGRPSIEATFGDFECGRRRVSEPEAAHHDHSARDISSSYESARRANASSDAVNFENIRKSSIELDLVDVATLGEVLPAPPVPAFRAG